MTVFEKDVIDIYSHVKLVVDALRGASKAYDAAKDYGVHFTKIHFNGFYLDGLVYHREDCDKIIQGDTIMMSTHPFTTATI